MSAATARRKKTASKKKATKKKTPAKKKTATKKKAPRTAAAKKKTAVALDESPSTLFHGVQVLGSTSTKNHQGVVARVYPSSIKVLPGFNPRGKDLGDIAELAGSIKSKGLIHPLVVRPGKVAGEFELIAGERRLRALQALGYEDPISVSIRQDLIGDDDRALALAIAENSEDGRTNLDMIAIGDSCKKLEKAGWPITRIAKEAGLHVQRVRRALKLYDAPEAVRQNVREGNWSLAAGLEFIKLDPKLREKIDAAQINETTTAQDIRKIRMEAEKTKTAKKAAVGESTPTKVSKKPSVTNWKGFSAKQAMIQEFSHSIVNAEPDLVGTGDWYEMWGALAWALWDRGDRAVPTAPQHEIDKSDPDASALQKDYATFMAVLKAEAAKYTPPVEEEGDEVYDGAEE